jgi:NAD(P)-dependent dehydrogenase (short-subunit alcohol dehydrogenase family)
MTETSPRIVVVTGASGGIGRLVVERFLAHGDIVIATDLSTEALASLPTSASLFTIAADTSSEADCQAVAELAQEKGGHVNVLVTVAGWFPVQPFEEITAADFRKVVDVNLTGVFLMIRAIWSLMKGRGSGSIVIVGSASTLIGVPSQVHYVAAKAGLFGLARSLARVMGDDGVTVNVVTPGLTSTPAVKQGMPAELVTQSVASRAIKREEQPEDLVGAIFFLASPDAAFISGQTINVDGGSHML